MLDKLTSINLGSAVWTLMALRGAVVAVNFVVMVWLAYWLGLTSFGVVAHAWAIASVTSTVVAAGGPLVLLRGSPEASLRQFLSVGLLYPAVLAIMIGAGLFALGAGQNWTIPVVLAFAINLSQCAASVMRARGSQVASMFVRDGLPIIVLGAVALWPATPEQIILRAAVALSLLCILALLIGGLQARTLAGRGTGPTKQGSLWLSSLLGMAVAQADLVVAGMFLPVEIFAIYALLRRVANLVALPVTVATWVCSGSVSDAFARSDKAALYRAATRANAIAWYPALVLSFAIGLGAIVLHDLVPSGWFPTFAVLLAASQMQAYWAAGYPVANLGPDPGLAVSARATVLALYGVAVLAVGVNLSASGHALAYALAISAGSFQLWYQLKRRFAVDTSARALWAGARV